MQRGAEVKSHTVRQMVSALSKRKTARAHTPYLRRRRQQVQTHPQPKGERTQVETRAVKASARLSLPHALHDRLDGGDDFLRVALELVALEVSPL